MSPDGAASQSAGPAGAGLLAGGSGAVGAGAELRIVDGGKGDGSGVKSEKLPGKGPLGDLFTTLHLRQIGRIAPDLQGNLRQPETARAPNLSHEEKISHDAEHGATRRSLQPSLAELRR